jgi:hypothetical protein
MRDLSKYDYHRGDAHDFKGGDPPPLVGVDYSWFSGALGGAHEYGDNVITDSNGRWICACDYYCDADQLCHILNSHAAFKTWGRSE